MVKMKKLFKTINDMFYGFALFLVDIVIGFIVLFLWISAVTVIMIGLFHVVMFFIFGRYI